MSKPRNWASGPQRADVVVILTPAEVRALHREVRNAYLPGEGYRDLLSAVHKIEQAARCAP